MMNDKPITKEMLEIYVVTLEKQVQQMSLVVKTLEELNEKIEKVDGKFYNLHSDLGDIIRNQIKDLTDKIERALTTLYLVKEQVNETVQADKDLNTKAYELAEEVKNKIDDVSGSVSELQTSIKIDRAVNIIGWASFLLSMLTIILKLFGKL
jgi:predicted transcriptional regulator